MSGLSVSYNGGTIKTAEEDASFVLKTNGKVMAGDVVFATDSDVVSLAVSYSGEQIVNGTGGNTYTLKTNGKVMASDVECVVTIVTVAPTNYISLSSPSAFTISQKQSEKKWNGDLYFSTNGTSWAQWSGAAITAGLSNGAYYIYFAGTGNSVITGGENYGWSCSGANITCAGNIESLLDYEAVEQSQHPTMNASCFSGLFRGWTGLLNAPSLPAVGTMPDKAYYYMFEGCASLTTPPSLPASKTGTYSYAYMFANTGVTSIANMSLAASSSQGTAACAFMYSGCTGLTAVSALPALNNVSLGPQQYWGMFKDCTSLTTAPALPNSSLNSRTAIYKQMFMGCTSLTTAPALPATTLAGSCYESMFEGCTALTIPPALPKTGSGSGSCYKRMFAGCTSLSALPEIGLTDYGSVSTDCCREMFAGCTGIQMSITQTAVCSTAYIIPPGGNGNVQADRNQFLDMFANTGGTFTGTPSINTTYYTNATIVSAS